ncbi:MAG: hypothetical protein U1F57_09550 [bacterium]
MSFLDRIENAWESAASVLEIPLRAVMETAEAVAEGTAALFETVAEEASSKLSDPDAPKEAGCLPDTFDPLTTPFLLGTLALAPSVNPCWVAKGIDFLRSAATDAAPAPEDFWEAVGLGGSFYCDPSWVPPVLSFFSPGLGLLSSAILETLPPSECEKEGRVLGEIVSDFVAAMVPGLVVKAAMRGVEKHRLVEELRENVIQFHTLREMPTKIRLNDLPQK